MDIKKKVNGTTLTGSVKFSAICILIKDHGGYAWQVTGECTLCHERDALKNRPIISVTPLLLEFREEDLGDLDHGNIC